MKSEQFSDNINDMQYVIMFITLLSVTLPGIAAERVQWLTDDKDDLKYFREASSHSIGMDTANIVYRQLTQFDLQLDVVSVSRIDKELRQTDNTCVSSRLKNPQRETDNLFSLPMNIHPLPQLFFHPERLNIPDGALNAKGELSSLAKLLKANPDAKLAVLDNISYGPGIDKMLSNVPSQQIVRLSLDNRYSATPKLLTEGMVDLSIEYPSHFFVQRTRFPGISELHSIPLQQSAQFLVSYIACSRSELGKQVIAEVNRILTTAYGSDEHIHAHLSHLPESSRDGFLKYYHQFFVERYSTELKVAVDHFPPWMIAEENRAPYGIDIDVAYLLADELNAKLEFLLCPFARCIRMMETGEADLYISMFKSAERDAFIHFIEPPTFTTSPQAFYLNAATQEDIAAYDDLSGLIVGLLRESQYFERFDNDTNLKKVPVVNYERLIDMLLKNRIDTFIGTEVVVDYLISRRGDNTLLKKATFTWNTERDVYLGLSKASAYSHLVPALGAAVKRLHNQEAFQRTYEDWLDCCASIN
ncbi:transporter substrate-binding domain-containing protein [Aestuariibacter salexigens]|uniref:transporter substrate-binding domain-containing protein n=1 Tax=Aestuariibacter salexigens TaxID=226010 RepID=UPI00146FB2A4|nr:transporter substrate-binding domain-containing protein [Aestuariibacter salexigens]